MRYFAKKGRNFTFFTLIGLFALIFSALNGVQAQKLNNQLTSEDSDIKQAAPAVLLVPNGFAAVSSTAFDNSGTTVRVVDITQFGGLWTNPANYAPFDSSGSMPTYLSWSPANFQGQTMRGLTITRSGTIIYAAASPYAGSNRTPNIYRINSTAVPTLLATLPGTNKYGIGSIDYDATHGLIFATNLDDGKIYAVNTSGAIVGSFDPMAADTSGTNLPPLGERLVAVAYHPLEKRVYYGVWGAGNNNTIRSVGLTATGAFIPGSDKLEITVAGSQTPVGDIEFSVSGKRMLVAEEPIYDGGTFVGVTAHNGRGLEYLGSSSTAWVLDPVIYVSGRKYGIGNIVNTSANARGGAAWGYASLRTSVLNGTTFNCDETFVLFTGDALRFDSNVVYGLQFTPSTGGSAGGAGSISNSLIADLDYNIVGQDKAVYHDVDIRKDYGERRFVSGGVYDRIGNPLANLTVNISFSAGNSLTAQTNSLGIYRFDDITPGETVAVSVTAKQYTFNEPIQIVTVEDDIADLNFHANE
jgi:hypothetical protein